MTIASTKRAALWLSLSVLASLLGLAIHNLQEFGTQGLIALNQGMIPMLVLQASALLIWWNTLTMRKTMEQVLLFLGGLHLVVGAFLTVLPLGFLPFEPEQTVSHYSVHVVYGVLQIPMILITLWLLRRDASRPSD